MGSDLMLLAVVNVSTLILPADLTRAVAACAFQIEHHLGPAWGVSARVEVFPDLDCLPEGAFPVLVADDEAQLGALGDHDPTQAMIGVNDANLMGVPWSCVLSHELCETVVNPRLDAFRLNSETGVEWALEVSDPVENQRYAYSGVALSDFVLPAFFDVRSRGVPLNWRKTLSAPFSLEPPNGHAITRAPGGSPESLPSAPMLAWKRTARSRTRQLLAG